MNLKIALVKRPDSTFPKNLDLFQVFYAAPPDPSLLREEEVIVKNRFISIDAAMRVWMTGAKTYMEQPLQLNDVMQALCVGEVALSRSKKFEKGDQVMGLLGWQKFAAMQSSKLKKLPQNYPNPRHFLGVLGISGMTAYLGLYEIGKISQGETVVVSTASGAVGEIAIQLAKLQGGKVYGIAGSDEKCSYVVKELGAVACLNYKKEKFSQDLKKACPKGVDVYFDNVGGPILDLVLTLINEYARIICCGAISGYNNNSKNAYGLKNYSRLIMKRAKMQGYIYTDYKDKIPEAEKQLMKLVQNGGVKFREDVINGLDNAPKALQKLFMGGNNGKVLVKIRSDKDDEMYYEQASL